MGMFQKVEFRTHSDSDLGEDDFSLSSFLDWDTLALCQVRHATDNSGPWGCLDPMVHHSLHDVKQKSEIAISNHLHYVGAEGSWRICINSKLMA